MFGFQDVWLPRCFKLYSINLRTRLWLMTKSQSRCLAHHRCLSGYSILPRMRRQLMKKLWNTHVSFKCCKAKCTILVYLSWKYCFLLIIIEVLLVLGSSFNSKLTLFCLFWRLVIKLLLFFSFFRFMMTMSLNVVKSS